MSDDSLLSKYAGYFAGLNWKVMPCHGINDRGMCTCGKTHREPKDAGKHPAINEWQVNATDDISVVQNWWNENQEYNLGVFCRPSGFFVIDIDPRSQGFESFEKFEELVEGALPPTVEAETGEYSHKGKIVRGRHLYYKVDAGEHLKGKFSKDENLPGIDIKHNGYVMVPPSRHVSGVEYRWKAGHAPWEIEMAEAPEELLATLRSGKSSTGASVSGNISTRLGEGSWDFLRDLTFKGEKLDVDRFLRDGIDEGSRAVDLYAMACAIANTVDVNTEMGRTMVETTMIRFNAEKVNPPLDLEGPGGLLMHVRRAIEFVAQNPKSAGRFSAPVTEWEKDYARKLSEGSLRAGAPEPFDYAPDPDSEDDIDDAMYSLPGTVGGAVATAAMSGKSARQAANLRNVDTPPDQDALTAEEGGTPERRSMTDVGNGRRLVDAYHTIMRYTPGLGWFSWTGKHWETDVENLQLRELCKQMASNISSEVVQYEDNERLEVIRWAHNAKSTARIDAAIKNANSDPRINVRVDEWDSNPYLLGVSNGVVDLRTGELLRGRPDLHITRRAPVAYTPGLQNSRWSDFLDFATGGDKEFQSWLQLAVGYTLTGLSTLDVMFLVYGKAGSGKNTFVEAVVKCLGTKQYAWPMDSTILAQNDGQAQSTDLYHWAQLRGRRMVWVDELPDGERLKENSVKKLTGSSEISARSPGEQPFTFQAQAKLWVTTNHRPIITDDAMWRRIRPIPWMHVPENPDPSLKEFLFDPEGGMPAILAWAVEGAMRFLSAPASDGLGWCKVVYEAAEIYRASEDRLGMFFSDELIEVPGGSVPVSSVHAMYRVWSESRGEKAVTRIRFSRMLDERDYTVSGKNTANAELVGYTLKTRAPSTSSDLDWNVLGRFAQ
jgi:putative DNA primase/helicase